MSHWQVWHPAAFQYPLEIEVEECSYPLLAFNGLIVVTICLFAPVACHSWNYDTAQFHLWRSHVYSWVWVLTRKKSLCMLVSRRLSRPSMGRADWPTRFQVSNILGGWNPTCSDWGYTNIYTRCWRTIFATLAWKYGIQQVSQMSTGIPRMNVSGYCKAWWKDGWSGRRLFWVPASQVQGTSVYFEHWLRGPKFQQSWTCLTQGSAESGQNASTRSGWESSSKRKSGRAAGVKNKVRPVLTTCTWRCSNMWE